MEQKARTTDLASSPPQIVTSAYLALALLLLPLAVHRAYFDITETKHAAFMLLSAAYVVCSAAVRIYAAVRQRHLPRLLPAIRALDVRDRCMAGFLLAFAVSALLSPDFSAAFFGATNRYQGVLTVLMYAMVWFCVSRGFAFHAVNEIALVAGFCVACLLAALQGAGCDMLFLQASLTRADKMRYVSTLGNINFYSGYVAVMLAYILMQWSHALSWRRALYGAALVLGACGALFTGSDSFALAMLVGLTIAPLLLFTSPRALRRYFIGILMLVCTMALLYWATRNVRALTVSFTLRLLFTPWGIVIVTSACLAAWMLVCRKPDNALTRLRMPYAWTLAGLFAAALIFLILANTVWRTHSFGIADKFLKLNGAWGTDRGRVWRFCMLQYRAFDPLHKLFGGGPGCLVTLAGKTVFPDAVLDSAHNEFLHYLLTIGAAGLACYIGLVGVTVAAVWRRCAARPAFAAPLVAAICYLAQSAVSIAQPASTPYLFIFLAILQGMLRETDACDTIDK